MVDVLLSTAAERVIGLIEEQARYHVNLVRGAEKEVRSLAEELQRVRNMMVDAENLRFMDEHIDSWLSRLELTTYELHYVLDEWSYAIRISGVSPPEQKVCSLIPSSSCFGLNKVVVHDIAKKIIDAKQQLDQISNDLATYGLSIPHLSISPNPLGNRFILVDLAQVVYGRDIDRDILVNELVDDDESGVRVVSIVGVGGLGKTTLAQLAYEHNRVKEYFNERGWVCVSNPFSLADVAFEVIRSMFGLSLRHTLEGLLHCIREGINGKRFLLVLDGVWTQDYNEWEPLINSLRLGGAGSKILVTTRNKGIAEMMGSRDSEIYLPELLSDVDCWFLLCRVALLERYDAEFEEIGTKIAQKCNGLPLAVVILGGLLRFKSSLYEWNNILYSEIWKMKEVEVDILPYLLVSYNDLSPRLKLCFSYCAAFPKNYVMDVETLIGNWMALGYLVGLDDDDDMELEGQVVFNNLAHRFLLQDDVHNSEIGNCKMHDIVHDFAQFLRKRPLGEAKGMKKSNTCQACGPSQVSSVVEFHCLYCDEKNPPNFCDCLKRLRVLSLKLFGSRRIPQGMENLIYLRWLNLTGISKLCCEDLEIILQLYLLQTLILSGCGLEEIPRKIGNLIHLRRLDLRGNESLGELPREIGHLTDLRRLDLSWNKSLKELPQEICNLIHLRCLKLDWNESLKELPNEIGKLVELRHLNLNWNSSLTELPKSICGLKKLETLNTKGCKSFCALPVRVTQLTDRLSMNGFRGGKGWCKLKLLKNLDHLDGVLWLRIRVDGDSDLEDAREAELRNKSEVEGIRIFFEESSSSVEVLDAVQPHPNLRELRIWNYEGTQLPMWMVSPLNQLRNLKLHVFKHLASLPPFGKFPCLEELCIDLMEELYTVGPEFLGITREEKVIAFPKLKKLEFRDCAEWKEWEDITVQEEESSVMPCLTELTVTGCNGLTVLPHCLLRKALSLEKLRVSGSMKLVRRYENEEGDDWKSISINNPRLRLICYS